MNSALRSKLSLSLYTVGAIVVAISLFHSMATLAGELGSKPTPLPEDVDIHIIRLPPSPAADRNQNCDVYASIYANALVALKDARRAADDAYRAWYDCEMRQQKPEAKPVISAEHSVLVKP